MKRSLPLLAVLCLLAACTTPATGPGRPATAAPTGGAGRARVEGLRPGMSAAQIITRFGQPVERKPFPTRLTKDAETWTYRDVIRTDRRMIATSTRDIPYFDPFSGLTRSVPESVYSMETVQTVRTMELLLLDGQLADWKVAEEEHRSLEP